MNDTEPLYIPEGWEAEIKLQLQQEATLAPLEMSATLARPTEPKVFCQAGKRAPATGHTVGTCSVHEAHENSHRDMHSGVTWADTDPGAYYRYSYPREAAQ